MLGIGLLSLFVGSSQSQPIAVSNLDAIELVAQWKSPWVAKLFEPDPAAAAIARQYLSALANQGLANEAQGLFVFTGTTTETHHQATLPLPAASLTKIATTLAALSTWPPNHRFETLIGVTGPIENGVVQGDLVIRNGNDPFFVWEEAIALGNALQAAGISAVAGDLVVLGDFTMNFEADPYRAGELLLQALDVQRWSPEIWGQYRALPPDTPQPEVIVQGGVQVQPSEATSQVSAWVVQHQSLPLVAILKAMNIYSNNVMAEQIANLSGGPRAVMTQVADKTQVPITEIQLINGSGLGVENQISPRMAVAMLTTLDQMLQRQGYTVADVLPVAGRDTGTLAYRDLPAHAALKTGSLATVSSLAGVFPTRDRGLVWFAILNQGGNLEGLRQGQDNLLKALQQHWGNAVTDSDRLQPSVNFDQPLYQLGNPQRNQSFRQ